MNGFEFRAKILPDGSIVGVEMWRLPNRRWAALVPELPDFIGVHGDTMDEVYERAMICALALTGRSEEGSTNWEAGK